MAFSDRQNDAFDNPAKALCRDGNLRVLHEAAYRRRGRLVTLISVAKGDEFQEGTILPW
jgi:hypothetical protein